MRRLLLAPFILTVCLLLAVAAFSNPAPSVEGTPAARPAAWNEIMGAGDIASMPSANRSDDFDTSEILRLANPATVFTLGDHAYLDGTFEEFTDLDGYEGSWGRPPIKNKTCPVVGNHDYSAPGFGPVGFNRYFAVKCPHRPDIEYATYQGADGATHQIKTVYAYRPAPGSGWWAYVLDSQCNHVPEIGPSCARDGNMLNWFRAHMVAHPAKCRIAFWHHPRFASWKNPSDDKVYWLYAVAAYKGRVSLVVNAHSHWFQRFTSLDPVTGGIDTSYTAPRSFTVGTGGNDFTQFTAGPIAGERYRDNTHFGVARFTLGDGFWKSEFDRTDGVVADKASASC